MPETTESANATEAPKVIDVTIKVEEGHTIAGEHYEKGAKVKVSPARQEKLKKRGII